MSENEEKINADTAEADAEQERPSSVDLQSTASPQGEATSEPSPQGKGDCLSAVDEAQAAEATSEEVSSVIPSEVEESQRESAEADAEQERPSSVDLQSTAPPQGEATSEPSPLGKGDRRTAVDEAQAAEVSSVIPSEVEESHGETAEVAVKMSPGKRAANIVVNVVVTLVLIFVVFMTVSIILSAGKDYTNFFGYTFLGVETDSMDGDREDSFAVGDLVTVKILDEDEKLELQVGDIVTFYTSDSEGVRIINSHRIVSVGVRMDGVQQYKTQGDNAPEADGGILTSTNVIGKVVGHTENIGYVVTWVSSSWGFFVCVVLPSFALVIYCIVNLILTVRTRNKVSEADKEEAMRQKILAEMEDKKVKEEAAAKSEAEKEAEMRKKILAEMGLNEDGSKKN